ncbi:hypothetical protein AXX17_AT5G43390 [Arabidopsis thaliana]|uniref:Uncharacterized protein n=1 Tax=Arabidopsis thaliana TaxID=3702 RepID=A0A178UR15_ARATH|nr:hypothetical protein AXX17_AT5G43390 [Arabidopsis thaliana]
MCIASGCAKRIDTAKLLAAEEAIQKLSECMSIENIIHQDNLDGEVIQTGSSSLLTASQNSLSEEMTQEQMVIDEDSLDVERKLFETEKLQIQTESSSLRTPYHVKLHQQKWLLVRLVHMLNLKM